MEQRSCRLCRPFFPPSRSAARYIILTCASPFAALLRKHGEAAATRQVGDHQKPAVESCHEVRQHANPKPKTQTPAPKPKTPKPNRSYICIRTCAVADPRWRNSVGGIALCKSIRPSFGICGRGPSGVSDSSSSSSSSNKRRCGESSECRPQAPHPPNRASLDTNLATVSTERRLVTIWICFCWRIPYVCWRVDSGQWTLDAGHWNNGAGGGGCGIGTDRGNRRNDRTVVVGGEQSELSKTTPGGPGRASSVDGRCSGRWAVLLRTERQTAKNSTVVQTKAAARASPLSVV